MKKNLLLVCLMLAGMYACGVKGAGKSDALSADAVHGKEIYTAKCGKCHPAFDVKSKPVDRWKQVLEPMIKDKAKLSEADGKLVSAYVWESLGVKG